MKHRPGRRGRVRMMHPRSWRLSHFGGRKSNLSIISWITSLAVWMRQGESCIKSALSAITIRMYSLVETPGLHPGNRETYTVTRQPFRRDFHAFSHTDHRAFLQCIKLCLQQNSYQPMTLIWRSIQPRSPLFDGLHVQAATNTRTIA